MRPASSDQQSAPDRDGAYNVRSVPVRLYLPDGPVMQDLVPPLLDDGTHTQFDYIFIVVVLTKARFPLALALF